MFIVADLVSLRFYTNAIRNGFINAYMLQDPIYNELKNKQASK